MPSLIDNLDKLKTLCYYTINGVAEAGWSPCDEIRYKEELMDAYPLLRAIVTAAANLNILHDTFDTITIDRDGFEALAKLLEEI